MNERIKMIREKLKLNQYEMAEILGYSSGAYNRLERGKSPIGEKLIRLICSQLNVNGTWLRTGAGEMFSENDLKAKAFEEFSELNPESQEIILDFMQTLLSRQQEGE